ncbi:hypothetical protein OG225_42640 (plasmid) [Nocardia sp. NBC_01377]|uniref:hypothetical protein n=1 Tax=Nocardia sp. NBC_01377 TaxID=2903595 RepID=UPI002F9079B6
MTFEILAWIGAFVLIAQSATGIPVALTGLVRACGQLLEAIRALRDRDQRQ